VLELPQRRRICVRIKIRRSSLARPGGNATGFTNFESAIGAKWLQILKELSPDTMRVAILFNPSTIPYRIFLHSIEAAAPAFGIDLVAIKISNAEEIEPALALFSREPKSTLLVLPDIFTITHRRLIIDLAARFSLPAVYPYGFFAQDGGLISYGIDAIEVYRDAATYVDRILRGAKPSELPVQASTKFERIVNLKTAQALSLTVPLSLLARADEVIE
jgi:putative ABC transport system substrate-binding protein